MLRKLSHHREEIPPGVFDPRPSGWAKPVLVKLSRHPIISHTNTPRHYCLSYPHCVLLPVRGRAECSEASLETTTAELWECNRTLMLLLHILITLTCIFTPQQCSQLPHSSKLNLNYLSSSAYYCMMFFPLLLFHVGAPLRATLSFQDSLVGHTVHKHTLIGWEVCHI